MGTPSVKLGGRSPRLASEKAHNHGSWPDPYLPMRMINFPTVNRS